MNLRNCVKIVFRGDLIYYYYFIIIYYYLDLIT